MTTPMSTKAYARPELLVDTDWLAGWVIRDGSRLDGTVSRTGRASARFPYSAYTNLR